LRHGVYNRKRIELNTIDAINPVLYS